MFLSSFITHKAILASLVAAAAAVAIAVTPTDLMRFRPRYLNFLDCIFHYSLQIIFKNLNNSFLTSDILNLDLEIISVGTIRKQQQHPSPVPRAAAAPLPR